MTTHLDLPTGGGQLVTLKDAANYITKLPKAEQNHNGDQRADDGDGRRGPLLHARIGMMQALAAGKPTIREPRKKRAKSYRVIQ